MKDSVDQFADAAAQFCRFIDNRREIDVETFARKSARLLSSLYLLAWELPDVSPGSKEALSSGISPEAWSGIAREIGEKFGGHVSYWLVFDPFELTDPVIGDLGDNLADIYRDLLTGLTAFRMGSEVQRLEAIWDWRFGFEVHWGRHLVSALRSLHALLVEYRRGESE